MDSWRNSSAITAYTIRLIDYFKVHKLFALLNLSHAYVTSLGRLVGVVALTEVNLVYFRSFHILLTFYTLLHHVFSNHIDSSNRGRTRGTS